MDTAVVKEMDRLVEMAVLVVEVTEAIGVALLVELECLVKVLMALWEEIIALLLIFTLVVEAEAHLKLEE